MSSKKKSLPDPESEEISKMKGKVVLLWFRGGDAHLGRESAYSGKLAWVSHYAYGIEFPDTPVAVVFKGDLRAIRPALDHEISGPARF